MMLANGAVRLQKELCRLPEEGHRDPAGAQWNRSSRVWMFADFHSVTQRPRD